MELKKDADMIVSYLTLRRCIGILGIALPFAVMLGGLLQQPLQIQSSISDYYYTNMRDFFVGLMCAVGLFLITYKGYDDIDNAVSITGGILAFGVAAFPTFVPTGASMKVGIFLLDDDVSKYIHLTSACLFFVVLALNSIFLFTKSDGKTVTARKRTRNAVYVTCGVVMLASIAILAVYVAFLQNTPVARLKPVLVLETLMLAAFGFSWLIKGETLFRDQREAPEE